MLWFLVSSPAQYEKLGKDWDKFASQPSGTGPFKLTKLVPRELAELTKNADYWDKQADSEGRQDRADPDAGSADAHQCAAGGPGRSDRDAGAGCGAAAQIRRHEDRRQRHAACLELSFERAARLALDRHPPAQGAQPRDRPRGRGRADERPGKARQGPGRPVEPVVRQADVRTQIRCRGGEEAGAGSRLFEGEAAEDDLHHRARRHRADAVAADERIPAAEFQGNRHRDRLQGGRARDSLYGVAQGRGRRDERRHHLQQHRLCHVRSALRHRPLLPLRPDRTCRRQLGRLQEPEGRRADRRGQADLRCRQAGRTAGAGACA